MIDAVAVVLAAGGSRRLGRPKQLLDYRGEPLIRHAVRVAIAAGCTRALVIQGAVEVSSLLEGLNVEVVSNEEWQEGISSSIRAAVAAAAGRRILFTTVDQPLVTPEHLRMLLALEAPIVATGYRAVAGIPVAFAAGLHGELLTLRGDRGARSVIDAHREELAVVPFEDAAFDVDRDADYFQLLELEAGEE
ncbi:MAG TPA: nucleotidyltransferase family protein [Thermoanaerobaculia bacterium]